MPAPAIHQPSMNIAGPCASASKARPQASSAHPPASTGRPPRVSISAPTILNLALWFAIHIVFRQVMTVDWHGIGPDLPVLSSIDWRAAVLSAMAMLAMFRLRLGMLPTLAICNLAAMVLLASG
ncbi:hypothetical protein [Xanthobacter autotrophicus]|uniref:hypothetical protein n=1 Tax=Xanthobacter autotrophicus TaxID=280 RepID=UPI00372B61BD